jgi:hypothetical protein
MRPEPIIYSMLFEGSENGQIVLNDLLLQFWKNPYVQGDPTQTAYNAGAMSVLDYINEKLNEAQENDRGSR